MKWFKLFLVVLISIFLLGCIPPQDFTPEELKEFYEDYIREEERERIMPRNWIKD